MKIFVVDANSVVLPHLSVPLFVAVKGGKYHPTVDGVWTEEGGSYPLHEEERRLLNLHISLHQVIPRPWIRRSYALSRLPKA